LVDEEILDKDALDLVKTCLVDTVKTREMEMQENNLTKRDRIKNKCRRKTEGKQEK